MAGPIVGITGSVAWAGSSVAAQLAGTGSRPHSFKVDIGAESFESTGYDTTGMAKKKKGIRGPVTGSFEVYMAASDHGGGTNGLVAFAPGTVVNANRWRMRINRPALTYVAWPDVWFSAKPGIIDWSGSFGGMVDDTTAMLLPCGASEPASGTFTYYDAATDFTLVGSIFTDRQSITAAHNALGTYEYNFVGSDALTHSAVGTGIIPDGALANDTATALTLTASTGRAWSGDAFWTSIDIECGYGALVKATVGFHGTGAWAIS